jgi:hypothetical protein
MIDGVPLHAFQPPRLFFPGAQATTWHYQQIQVSAESCQTNFSSSGVTVAGGRGAQKSSSQSL